MTESKLGKVTLIEIDSPWSRACLTALQSGGFESALQDPTAALMEEEVRHKLFVVPIGHYGSEKFDLVRQIGDMGGLSLVLAGSDAPDIALKSMTIKGTYYSGQKSLDFNTLVENAKIVGRRLDQKRPT